MTNFHTKPLKGYIYFGDVNPEYGGIHYSLTYFEDFKAALESGKDFSEWVSAVELAEGPNEKQFYVLHLQVELELTAKKLERLREDGVDVENAEAVFICLLRGEDRTDTEWVHKIQKGKLDEYDLNPMEVDTVYRGNTSWRTIMEYYA